MPTYLEQTAGGCGQTPVTGASSALANLASADLQSAPTAPYGAIFGVAGWTFSSPSGTTITAISGSDDLWQADDDNWRAFIEDASGAYLPGQSCTIPRDSDYCQVTGPFSLTGISTTSLTIGVSCAPNSSQSCGQSLPGYVHFVWAELDSAVVTIDDPIAPSSVTATSTPGDVQHGITTVTASAADSPAGIVSLSVTDASGAAVGGPATPPGGCDYTSTTPCPQTADQRLGAHQHVAATRRHERPTRRGGRRGVERGLLDAVQRHGREQRAGSADDDERQRSELLRPDSGVVDDADAALDPGHGRLEALPAQWRPLRARCSAGRLHGDLRSAVLHRLRGSLHRRQRRRRR